MALAPPPASASSAVPFTLDDDDDEDNNLASLMPHFCTKLNEDTITELDFQDIHRFLSLKTSKEKALTPKGGSLTKQPLATYCKRKDRDVQTEGLDASEKSSPSARREYSAGKENTVFRKVPRRHTFSRREGSDRITSHRTFKVDLRSFGSILNNGVLEDSQIPCDVHAFWEAEDEREASEAIMRKLHGEAEPCSKQSVSKLRRPCVRRKGSQRRTKSRCITLDLPSYAKQVQLLDVEQLEEEDVNVEFYTFVKNSELKMKDDMNANESIAIAVQDSQHVNSDIIHSDLVRSKISPPDETDKPSAQLYNDDDMQIVLSDVESPVLHTNDDGQCMLNQMDSIVSKGGPIEDMKGLPTVLQSSEQVTFDQQTAAPVNSSAADKKKSHAEEDAEITVREAIKVTPYEKPELIKIIPLTSPTPPSNPLAVLGFRKDIVSEGIGKRKLDFDSAVDDSLLEPALLTSTGKDLSCLEKSSANSAKSVQINSSELTKEKKLVSFNDVPDITNGITEQCTKLKNPHKKNGGMRKKTVNRRSSLAASGTNWDNGVRRSTRIRSRPLDFWRGERFLYGRVHKSLTTVIGIKYSSPPPCWPQRHAECPKFKVESFVSEKYADYVQFAALC